MALEEGRYFTGVMSDQRYNADPLAEYCRRFITSGVWELADNLKVSAGSGMHVIVNYGAALVDGYLYKLIDNGTGPLTLVVDNPDSQPRIDRVVICKDAAKKRIYAYIKKGTPGASPNPPDLDTTDENYEISIFKISVPIGINAITAGNLIDDRESIKINGAAPGRDGSTWLSGTTVPVAGTGNDGDYYVRTDTYDVYYKSGGSWSVSFNIKGIPGTPGSNGTKGLPSGVPGIFSNAISDADPGSGKFALNNATPASATYIYANSSVFTASLNSIFGYSLHAPKGFVKIIKADGSAWSFYAITSITAGLGYYKIMLQAYVAGSGTFTNGDPCELDFATSGTDGTPGGNGTNGATWTSGTALPTGGNSGDYYLKTDTYDVYKNTSGTWAVLLNIKGISGTPGNNGIDGLGYIAASTTSITMGTGAKAFTITQTTSAFAVGDRVRIIYNATNYMEGIIASYSGTIMNVTVDTVVGSGTYAAWTFSITGIPGSGTANGVVSSIAGHFASFADTLGKNLADSGKGIADFLNSAMIRTGQCTLNSTSSVTVNFSSPLPSTPYIFLTPYTSTNGAIPPKDTAKNMSGSTCTGFNAAIGGTSGTFSGIVCDYIAICF